MSTLPMQLAGSWSGTNHLFLSWLPNPEHLSQSQMTVTPEVRGRFLRFNYTWEHERNPHEGTILIGHDRETGFVTGAWADSWHQSARIFSCEGKIDDDGSVSVTGSYPAPPGPDWGWRIRLIPVSEASFRMEMHNIMPDGKEDLAVRTEYTRTS